MEDKKSIEASAKNLRRKMWWLNIVGVVFALAALVMLIITPLGLVAGLGVSYEALWATVFTSQVNTLKTEASLLINVFVEKYRKDHGLEQPKKGKK